MTPFPLMVQPDDARRRARLHLEFEFPGESQVWHNPQARPARASAAMTLTRFQSKSSEAAAEAAPRLHIVTFGCQMNKYDSLLVEGRFKRRGYVTTERLEEADVVLFNTCSVREHAEERTYSWLGELKRAKAVRPDLVVGVMGCMAQRVGEEIFARAGHVDIVAGTRQFARLPDLVERVREHRSERVREHRSERVREHRSERVREHRSERVRDHGPERVRDGGSERSDPDGTGARRGETRGARVLALEMDDRLALDRADERSDGALHAYLTVMRGCDLNCTYCIVPTVRGRVMSYPVDHLVREAEWFVSQGARVITLLGQTVNSYGEDFAPPAAGELRGRGRQGRPGLADLLYRLQEIRDLARIRCVTLHPSYVTPALGQAIAACDKVDRFLPIPAQSGSDRILRAMKRGYTVELYRRRMDALRERVPDIELGSDWIVGFPGESDEDFAASESLLAEQGFAVNYVFKYDPRPGTSACETLADDVPVDVKRERNQRLLDLSERVATARFARHVGHVRTAIVESASERNAGTLIARTVHQLPVTFAGSADLVGRVVSLRIDGAGPYGLSGSRA
jgi:tRNA-2-methylthio-N6-dimethylallyladenosine synthase